jgi:hypothetical protein
MTSVTVGAIAISFVDGLADGLAQRMSLGRLLRCMRSGCLIFYRL